MKKNTLLCVVLLILLFQNSAFAEKLIKLSDYGVQPNTFENIAHKLSQAFKDAKNYKSVTIKLPKGRLDIWPEGSELREYYVSNATESNKRSKVKTIGLLFENMKNVTLEGDETLLMFHGKMTTFAIDDCENITLKNISIDFERPTMSEMTLSHKSDTILEFTIHPDSKYEIINDKIVWYGENWRSQNLLVRSIRKATSTMHGVTWEPFDKAEVEELGPNKVRFTGNFEKVKESVGDVYTIRDPYRDACGGFINRSRNTVIENVNVHYFHGMGIISQFSENISLNNVIVAPRKNSGRVVATFADCFHFSGCYGDIKITNCKTSGSHDDPINVHGTNLQIQSFERNKVRVKFGHHQTWGFKAFDENDIVEFIDNKTLLPYFSARVKKVRMISKKEIELELNKKVPKQCEINHCIENATKTPNVIVKNCYFERANTRGVLVTTRGKVLIENNTFFRIGMHAILIADDCNSWFESGYVRDVTIQNNTFTECGYMKAPNSYVIAILPETHNYVEGKYVHSNIRIIGNKFNIALKPLMVARNTEKLVFSNNEINYKPQKWFTGKPNTFFNIEHCSSVKSHGNTVAGLDADVNTILQSITKE